MIDVQNQKLLALEEHKARRQHEPEVALIIRNARRYLALRDAGVIVQLQSDEWLFAGKLDKAADRILEGGE